MIASVTLALLASVATSSSAASASATNRFGPPPREKGVGLGLFASDPKYDYSKLIREIHQTTGATHLSLTWVWWQQDADATEIKPVHTWSATDTQILKAIRLAKSLGFHVTAFPIVRLIDGGQGDWRGKIRPSNESHWWASYEAYIFRAARLAKLGGAARLSVGSELVSREGMRGRWLQLIEQVRLQAPKLELMYSANWDHHREVTFWDAVDVIGLTAYWELTRNNEPTVGELVEAWKPVRSDLGAWSDALNRPLVITEIGYPSLDGAASWPWDETRNAPIDLEEQRIGYEAFVQAFAGAPFLNGVYWWNWFGFGGPQDTGFSPRGKPAAKVIRRWFGPRRH